MKIKFPSRTFMVLITGLTLLSGCVKTGNSRKVIFKGFLMKSCDSPFVHHTMWVNYYEKANGFGGSGKSLTNIGSDTSRSDGYFEIICSLEGNAEYSFIVDGEKKFTYDGSTLWGAGDIVVDLGKIMCDGGTIPGLGVIRFDVGNPSPTDTLYIQSGYFGNRTFIYPVSNYNYFPISIGVVTSDLPYYLGFVTINQQPYKGLSDIVWGRGLQDYEVAFDSSRNNKGNYHEININGRLNICGYIDTIVVPVP